MFLPLCLHFFFTDFLRRSLCTFVAVFNLLIFCTTESLFERLCHLFKPLAWPGVTWRMAIPDVLHALALLTSDRHWLKMRSEDCLNLTATFQRLDCHLWGTLHTAWLQPPNAIDTQQMWHQFVRKKWRELNLWPLKCCFHVSQSIVFLLSLPLMPSFFSRGLLAGHKYFHSPAKW